MKIVLLLFILTFLKVTADAGNWTEKKSNQIFITLAVSTPKRVTSGGAHLRG